MVLAQAGRQAVVAEAHAARAVLRAPAGGFSAQHAVHGCIPQEPEQALLMRAACDAACILPIRKEQSIK